MSTDVLARIRQALPGLRPTEQRIGAAILADPTAFVGVTVADLARVCETSLASVNRFCHSLGYRGYPDFRLELAFAARSEEAAQARFGVSDSDISPSDSVQDVVAKIAYHEASTVQETAAGIDLQSLDAVAEAIIGASRIDIYGVASSGLAGTDLQQKLHRIGMTCHNWTDIHLALTSAALLTEGTVAIGISHSGRTVETNHALAEAKRAGATTVAITNHPESPLAASADLVLTTFARETRYRSGAMSSRIAQLTVVDFLFVRIAQRTYDSVAESLKATYTAVQLHRLGDDAPTRGCSACRSGTI